MKRIFLSAVTVGVCLAACEKNEVINVPIEQAQTVMYNQCDGGGDVDEDIIIEHSVMNSSSNPISGATVQYWKTHGSMPFDTKTSGANGESIFTDDSTGCRFFITSASGYKSDTTSVFFLSKDTLVRQTLQSL